ncbi:MULTISPECIES: hypothetical protein [Streptomyces]|uniref:Uncharacterized protein n=1 Tax=Streptomyces rimosus subsp. rimosus TaxID=132474 RepID=A0ABY3Z9M2_STRRM|nr:MULTISPECIES: hypothetical protein [Streptomyces]UNZ06595.1 hypothetical protein SRIMR7_31025 [Streptomyces rimosus subsp. rimosus]UTH98051.1 hypothetical protein SRIMHP_28400 [Streptomyces rimosus subsp. rimosus]UTJ16149.1 hypothetical protein SRIMDV3_28300 [Streptomyces rimosus subsp. rimosus]
MISERAKGVTVSDIAVDYELLNDVAQKAGKLKEEVKQARESKQEYSVDEVGSRTAVAAIRKYYSTWKGSFKRSEEKLEKLKNLYDGVAKKWADWDFDLANKAAKQSAQISSDLWKARDKEWNAWHEAVEQAKKEHPDIDPSLLPKEPEKPGERPHEWTTDDGHGNKTTTTYEYGPDGEPTKITTTMETRTGLKSTDTTNYHPDGTYDSKSTDVFGNVTNTTGTSSTTETTEHKTTTDDFTSKTKDTEGNESTTTGTTTSVTDQKTGHRDTKTTYTTVGPDEDGNEQTVKGTTHSSVDLNGHEVTTTIEVKEDGSGTKTVVTDGKTEEWTSDDAKGDTGWKPKKSDD